MPAGPGSPPAPDRPLVQQLLAERRELKVAHERLRLELREAASRVGRPDPRLRLLETENRRLREQLTAARADRDALLAGVLRALQEMEAAAP